MAHLMQFKQKDVLEISLLKSTDDQPITSPTPTEEAALLDEPQNVPATATCPLWRKEQAPKSECAAGLG